MINYNFNIQTVDPKQMRKMPSPKKFIPRIQPIIPFNSFLTLGQKGISQLNSPDDMNSAHYLSAFLFACLDLRAGTIARYPIVGIDSKGVQVFGPKVKKSQKHYFYRLLQRPNPEQDEFQFRYLIQRYLDALGNCVVYLDDVDPKTDLPGSLWPLDPARCAPAFDENSGVHIGYTVLDPEGREFFIAKSQTIHFKTPNPNNIYWGEGRVQIMAKEINLDAAITEYISQFFNQGATTSGYLTTDTVLSEESFQRLAQESVAFLTGLKNAHRLPLLEAGAKYMSLGASLDKLGVEKLQEVIMKKMLTGFLIPGTKFGLTEFSSYKAEEMEKSFIESMMDVAKLHIGPLCQLAARFDRFGKAVPEEEMETAKSGYMSRTNSPKGIRVVMELPAREAINVLVGAATALAQLHTLTPDEQRATSLQLIGQYIMPVEEKEKKKIDTINTLMFDKAMTQPLVDQSNVEAQVIKKQEVKEFKSASNEI